MSSLYVYVLPSYNKKKSKIMKNVIVSLRLFLYYQENYNEIQKKK